MKLYPEELATVLAALRFYQSALGRHNAALGRDIIPPAVDDIATDGGELRAMTPDQIEKLCGRINTDSFGEPRLNVPADRLNLADKQTPEYERGFEDGLRDGHGDAAGVALPALRLALDRLELSDYDGDESESMAKVSEAIAKLEGFGAEQE